jgi:drug/metabolite transporter (DMT)-like permease
VFHALATIAAFFLVVRGYRDTEPSVGGIIGLTEILFGILFGIVLFSERITPLLVTGSLCILAAASIPNIADTVRQRNHT